MNISFFLLNLPKFLDSRGNLSFYENFNQIPFLIKRVHWIYDVPGGEVRGGLACKDTEEFIVAMSGSFDVVIDDGYTKNRVSLNRSYVGVYIPKGYWRTLDNFSTNSVAVIAASSYYTPNDNIRDYDVFLNLIRLNPFKINGDNINDENENTKDVEKSYKVIDCGMIQLDRHHSDRRGDICVVENKKTVPFSIKRVYYLYDVPGGESRGGHAHKNLCQLMVAVSGSFSVTLDDGNEKRVFTLNRPYQGLLIKPGVWRTLDNFSSGSVCLVLASEKYNVDDYIRNYQDFINYRKEQ